MEYRKICDKARLTLILMICFFCTEPCHGNANCVYCKMSESRAVNGKHWLSWYVTMTRNWALHVDDMKHRNNQSEWFFVGVPIRSKDRIKNFMSAIVGKPLNWKGFTALMFCSSHGCRKDSISPASMPSFFCSECFAG